MPDLLPSNATPQELALERSTARVGAVDVPVGDLWNPQTCPVSLLPWLAWALSVDVWDDTWSESVKRAQIQNSISIHRRKGTVKAVKDVVASFGSSLVMTEWFENASPPYTFDLILTMGGSTPSDAAYQAQITSAIDRVKNVRSTYTLSLGVSGLAEIVVQAVARAITYTRFCFNEA